MDCPHCGSMSTVKNGHRTYKRKDGSIYVRQSYKCKKCGRQFLDTTSKRGGILIPVPRPMMPNLFYELKTFLQANANVRLRKGDVDIRELPSRQS